VSLEWRTGIEAVNGMLGSCKLNISPFRSFQETDCKARI
jgi:hypothetical protein